MSISPYALAIDSVEWQAFGSLTFRREANARRDLQLFLRLVRRACKLGMVDYETALWVLRREKGEHGGRNHLHFLIGGFPARWMRSEMGVSYAMEFWTVTGCFWVIQEWNWGRRGGWARCRPIEKLNDSASAYILKANAEHYERSKFREDVLISNSLIKSLDGCAGLPDETGRAFLEQGATVAS